MELLSDHAALGAIIGTDLYRNPGLSKIYFGEGAANLINSLFSGLGSCSYGEGISTVGFSKVASTWTTLWAAIIMIVLGFFGPVQALITSIPSCVFCGAALILYGFIACSGIKMLQQVDLNDNKNITIVSVVLSLPVCIYGKHGVEDLMQQTRSIFTFDEAERDVKKQKFVKNHFFSCSKLWIELVIVPCRVVVIFPTSSL